MLMNPKTPYSFCAMCNLNNETFSNCSEKWPNNICGKISLTGDGVIIEELYKTFGKISLTGVCVILEDVNKTFGKISFTGVCVIEESDETFVLKTC